MSRVILITCGICVVAAAGIGLVSYYQVTQAQSQDTLTPVSAEYRHIVGEVSISGTSEAYQAVDLAFGTHGIVESVLVDVGDAVATSSLLMSLRSGTLKSQLAQAKAVLRAETAKLRDLTNGTQPERIAITQASLEGATDELLAALGSAQSAADLAIRLTVDEQFIANPTQYSAATLFTTSDGTLDSKILSLRRGLQTSLVSWNTRLNTLQAAGVDELLEASADMRAYLQTVLNLLDALTRALAINSSTEISTHRTLLSSARTSVASAREQVVAAQAALTVVRQELGLDEAGPTDEATLVQSAVADGAQARVDELYAALRDEQVIAPWSGIVTAVEAEEGEVAALGAPVVSMVSRGPLKVEGYVPEIHYGAIVAGQRARIELDAFLGEPFEGTVSYIDPVAVLRDGIPNFKVTISFVTPSVRLAPGLTARAYIETADKAQALAIPLAAVTGSGRNATVLRLDRGTVNRTPVTLGAVSTDGYVEVTSGLTEGDEVLVNETKQYRIVPN